MLKTNKGVWESALRKFFTHFKKGNARRLMLSRRLVKLKLTVFYGV
jgi:hypothetical protein